MSYKQIIHLIVFLKKIETVAEKDYILPSKSFIDESKNRSRPRLRLTIRASGIKAPGSNGNLAINIPEAVVSKSPPLDIKLHSSRVLFHLPPCNSADFYSSLLLSEDNASLKLYKQEIRELYRQAYPGIGGNLTPDQRKKMEDQQGMYAPRIRELAKTKLSLEHIAFFTQTAFSNTGGNARSVITLDIGALKQIPAEEALLDLTHSLVV